MVKVVVPAAVAVVVNPALKLFADSLRLASHSAASPDVGVVLPVTPPAGVPQDEVVPLVVRYLPECPSVSAGHRRRSG